MNNETTAEAPENALTFRERSDAFRRRCRMGRFTSNNKRPFVNPPSDRPKGKKACRAAKRETVKAMKAARQLTDSQA